MDPRHLDISPFIVMDIMQTAADRELKGLPVHHMEVGQPSLPAPPKVILAAKKALDKDRIGYTTALGLEELRRTISFHYKTFYDVNVPYENIIITTGVSAGLVLSLLSCFKPGENIGLITPGYPCYKGKISALSLKPVEIRTTEDNHFLPTIEQLESLETPLNGLILTSPSNPTGSVINDKSLRTLGRYCQDKGIWLISDEIYHGITYEEPANTLWGSCDSGIIVNGFSKYFCMTGWRLGWMIVPDRLIRMVELLTQNFYMAAPTLSQIAAISAFDDYSLLNGRVEGYKQSRDLLLKGLQSLGFNDIIVPQGAFYMYVKSAHLTRDSYQFCIDLLDKTGLAITPGLDFDSQRGSDWIRFSFTRGTETVEKALRSMENYLSDNFFKHQNVS